MAEKKKKVSNPNKTKNKKVKEVFEVGKKGEEKIVEKTGTEKEIIQRSGQIEKENKQLRNVLIGIGVIVLIIVGFAVFVNSIRHFEYDGVKFEVVKEGDLIFYNTKLKMYNSEGEHVADYNFFLRKNPKKILADVPFEVPDGILLHPKLMVLNYEDFDCEGDGVIAIANMNQLFTVMGIKTMRDENATCSSSEKYTYINIRQGNETKIIQTDDVCYEITIKDCEILEGTEKFMLETFVKLNS